MNIEEIRLIEQTLGLELPSEYVLENGACGGPWPNQYFIIGINGCGDYYVIKHQESKFSVGFADHQLASIDFYAKDLEEFTTKLLKEMRS